MTTRATTSLRRPLPPGRLLPPSQQALLTTPPATETLPPPARTTQLRSITWHPPRLLLRILRLGRILELPTQTTSQAIPRQALRALQKQTALCNCSEAARRAWELPPRT